MARTRTSPTSMTAGTAAALAPVNDPGSLAQQFYRLSQALDDFRLDHWDALSSTQRGQLKDEAQALDSRAHYLTAGALGQLSQAIQPELAAIAKATDDAQAALENLQKVDRAVSIAIATVALGSAVATGNIASIGSAVKTLTDTISAAVLA